MLMNNLPYSRFLIDYKITFYLIAHFKVFQGTTIGENEHLMMFESIGGESRGYMLCVDKEGLLSCQVGFASSLDFKSLLYQLTNEIDNRVLM